MDLHLHNNGYSEKEGASLFQKKELIFSENMGVCRVEKIVKLSAEKVGDEGIPYYVLRALDGKRSYIPVEHHEVLLRPLLGAKEAKEKLFEAASKTQKADKQDAQAEAREEAKTFEEIFLQAGKTLPAQELAELRYVLGQAGEEL